MYLSHPSALLSSPLPVMSEIMLLLTSVCLPDSKREGPVPFFPCILGAHHDAWHRHLCDANEGMNSGFQGRLRKAILKDRQALRGGA